MNDAAISETILSRKRVYDGKIIHVEHWQAELPNGAPAFREVAVNIGACAIVPVDDMGNVYLERQYRCPAERVLLEIPAGKLNFAGEDPLDAAKRELSEETGLSAGRWTKLTELLTTPAFCTEKITVYLAEGLSEGETHPDADEFLEIIKMPIAEAQERVMKGEITDGKTIVGLMMACSLLGISSTIRRN